MKRSYVFSLATGTGDLVLSVLASHSKLCVCREVVLKSLLWSNIFLEYPHFFKIPLERYLKQLLWWNILFTQYHRIGIINEK